MIVWQKYKKQLLCAEDRQTNGMLILKQKVNDIWLKKKGCESEKDQDVTKEFEKLENKKMKFQ